MSPRASRGSSASSRTVLITGAAGFVGAAIRSRLEERGVRVTGVGHHEPPGGTVGPGWLWGDLTDPGFTRELPAVDSIVHVAAALPPSFEVSEREAAVNRALDDNVLDCAVRMGAQLIYASGTSLYAPGDSPRREGDPIAPSGPYLAEKERTESRGLALAREGWLDFSALRVSAPYGPRQRARTVIQLFIERALRTEPLEYFGSGTREQDFTYVEDVADAFAAALESPSGVFNVASGRPVTMKGLALIVARQAGLGEDAVRAAGRPDPREGALARFNVSAAKDVLRWQPSTSLEEGISRCIEERRAA
jgi:UDP-glucose 4-epimerase